MKSVFDIPELPKIVSQASCYSEVFLEVLGRIPRGSGHYRTLKSLILRDSIDISHFSKKRMLSGLKKSSDNTRLDLHAILAGKFPEYPTTHLKKRLWKEGIRKRTCEDCGNSDEWNGKPLTMHLDHKDGDSRNHRLENLQILCPNCHSQTPTFSRKKI